MRFFNGQGSDLGTVRGLPEATFADLCAHELALPVQLQLTRAAYHLLPKAGQAEAKRVRYITPAAFKKALSRRVTAEAAHCNLVALDIDDADEAKRLLTQRWGEIMLDYGYIAYHTATSTPEAPRLRVLVAAAGLPLARYSAAVQFVADMLGLTSVTRESMVPVQPMFWPTVFAGEDASDCMVAYNYGGSEIADGDLPEHATPRPTDAAADSDPEVADLSYLRVPIEGVSLEDAKGALAVLDPDCPMQEWIEIACALKHQFSGSEAALALWQEWSEKGTKYPGEDELAYRWSTLKAQPADRAPVTIRSLFKKAQEKGWVGEGVAKQAYARQLEWIKSTQRSAEELLDRGAQGIASVAALIGDLEKTTLTATLRDRLVQMGHKISATDVKKAVRKVEAEAARGGGVPAWAKGILYVTALNTFYRPSVDRKFTPEVLDLIYSSPPVGEDKPPRARDYLIQEVGVSQVENLRYEPRMAEKLVFTEKGVPYVNTYRPPNVKPNAEGAAAAGAIFTEHIERLVLEPEHRATLLDFLTFMVQHPGEKIRWAVLLQGGMGCGKTFLAVAMKALLGPRNVRKLTATDVMEGTSNGWAYGQQLIVLEEVRITGTNRYSVMDKLKPCISDDDISLRELYQPHRTVPNICNYLMFTNHHDSLAVHDEDRRYFVLSSPLQEPKDIAGLPVGYFERLYGMVRDNAAGLRSWFETRAISPEFTADGRAPVTKYMKDLVEAAASPLVSTVLQTIGDEPHALVRKDLVSISCLRGCMDSMNLPPFSDHALANILREKGWKKEGRFALDGVRHSLWSKGIVGDPLKAAWERSQFL